MKKETLKTNLKGKSGITLIALIVTIIVLLILAGVAISALTGSGLFEKAEEAKETQIQAQAEEEISLAIAEVQLRKQGEATLEDLVEELKNKEDVYSVYETSKKTASLLQGSIEGSAVNELEAIYIINVSKYDGHEVKVTGNMQVVTTTGTSVGKTEVPEVFTPITDGSWNETAEVNAPKTEGTGLIPVYFNSDGSVTELTSESSEEDWAKWYDYDNQKWANAITKNSSGQITGYWVWIPRFAYQIASGCNTSTAGTINIKFLKDETNEDKDGNTISTEYPTVTSGAMADYVVHPSFIDGSNKTWPYSNGEWDSELSGYWVAKFPAGYAGGNNSVAQTSTGIKYSGTYSSITNYYGTVTSGTTEMKYPVFLGQTYAYNYINIGDSYNLALNLTKSGNIYNLESSAVSSHQMKNSEWGAVAYLSHSSYGYNGGNKIYINNVNLNNTVSTIYAVTGYAGEGTDTAANSFSSAPSSLGDSISGGTYTSYAWYTANGQKGSSTQNITGVYDLSGCVFERVSAYITNGNDNISNYGSTFASTSTNSTGYQSLSSKLATVYPYNSSDSYENNWATYSGLKSSTYGFGDAVLETSTAGSGSTSWNSDYSDFPFSSIPFFIRGGAYYGTSNAGAFAFTYYYGNPIDIIGFRAVLVAP